MIPILSQPPAEEHIAACGLFCTNCGAFRRKKCQGCQIAPMFACCPVRACCHGQQITTCAQCPQFAAPQDYGKCRKVNNLIAKIIAFLFKSDRPAALAMLRDQGREAYLYQKRQTGKQ